MRAEAVKQAKEVLNKATKYCYFRVCITEHDKALNIPRYDLANKHNKVMIAEPL